MKQIKHFAIFIFIIGMIAVVAAAYFLFIQEETQIPEQVQQEEKIYTKEYGNKKVFAIEPA